MAQTTHLGDQCFYIVKTENTIKPQFSPKTPILSYHNVFLMEKILQSRNTSWVTVAAEDSDNIVSATVPKQGELVYLGLILPQIPILKLPNWISMHFAMVRALLNFTTVDPVDFIFGGHLMGTESYDVSSPYLAPCQIWTTDSVTIYFPIIIITSH